MTVSNLNRTWRDVVFKQYEDDLEENAPFPIRYLINAPSWHRDIIINIPHKITLETFRKSIFTFFHTVRSSDDPIYKDDNLSIRPQKSPSSPLDVDAAKDEIDSISDDAPAGGSS
jgi:hypothetical protein